MSFNLKIITPDKIIYEGLAKKLIIPSVTGQLTILGHHAPLFTMLKDGLIEYFDNNGSPKNMPIGKGMIEIKNNIVSLLIESPEHSLHADKIASQLAQDSAQKIDKTKLKPMGKIASEDAFRRSFIDFKDVKRKKKPRSFSVPTALK